ncbi:MAG: ABC transporter ATP-binding protein [Chloroflexi bacterium]|nr:ABC transporter ATP-binding protein [Chloroflexota bacterium]
MADPVLTKQPAPSARVTFPSAPILRVSDVHKSFRRHSWLPGGRVNQVLRGASFAIRPGKMIGLVGENGSGKSVLLKIIVGLMKADEGSVELSGRLGYCPQIPLLYDKLTSDETFRLFAHAYELDDAYALERAEHFYEFLNFGQFRGELIENLSGGTKQKLNLAIALMHEPQILLLDEPYSGFDWDTYQRFWQLADSLRDSGTTFVIVSHFIEERSHFDRILRVRDGLVEDEDV